jgi:hypothetical protein
MCAGVSVFEVSLCVGFGRYLTAMKLVVRWLLVMMFVSVSPNESCDENDEGNEGDWCESFSKSK